MELLKYIYSEIDKRYNVSDIINNHLRIHVTSKEEFDAVISIMDKKDKVYVSDTMRDIYKDFGDDYPNISITVKQINSKNEIGKGYKYRVCWCPLTDKMVKQSRTIKCSSVIV